MGMEKFAAGASKAAWDNYKSDFFKYLERKVNEGAKRYPALGELRKRWIEIDWGFAEKQYLSYVQEFFGYFYIFDNIERKSLHEISIDVFLKYPPDFRKEKTDEGEEKTISGLRMVFNDKRGQKLFIWGEPGAGKTTFLKQVLQAAIAKDKIPLFISIAEWARLYPLTKEGLLDYLGMQFEDCGFDNANIFIEFLIDENTAILLFDGLDEIQSKQREKVHLVLKRLQNNKSQVLVTCRIDATQYRLINFFEVQIGNWDSPRIINFVSKIIPNPVNQKKFFIELNDREHKSLRNFMSNPLLLSLLCLVFDPQEGFPENRGEIYKRATRYLITDRDKVKEIPVNRETIHASITLPIIDSLYAQLAYQTFNNEESIFEREQLENQINKILAPILGDERFKELDASQFLPVLVSQHGILARNSHRTYSFTHLTFQEYYAAKYIVDKKLFDDLATHLNDSRWREVFLLTASQIEE